MSGGSYEYAYSRIEELSWLPDTLDAMAARCRSWARDTETFWREGQHVPVTTEQRARILVRALLLERAATRMREAIAEVEKVKQIMHDVEWVASSDWTVGDLMEEMPS